MTSPMSDVDTLLGGKNYYTNVYWGPMVRENSYTSAAYNMDFDKHPACIECKSTAASAAQSTVITKNVYFAFHSCPTSSFATDHTSAAGANNVYELV